MFSAGKSQTINPSGLRWFLLLLVISLIAARHTLDRLFWLAWTNDAYTHILLIVPISAGLIYLDWPADGSRFTPSWRVGGAFLLAAFVIAVLGEWRSTALAADVQLSVFALAVALWWIGAFISCFGTRVASSLLFPLCFLLWLVPFPSFLLDAIVNGLQHGSAYAAQLLFNCVGVPVVQDGIRLTIPGLTVEVAQECSSIRSSMILLVTTMVVAQLFLRSPWRKALVIAIVFPLSLAKNGLRIFTIAMLGTKVDPAFLNGKLHHHGGVIFLALALGVIFLLLWVLREGTDEEFSPKLRPAISSAQK